MELTKLELLYVRYLVVQNIEAVQHRLYKYTRYAEGGHFDDVYQEKVALAETEMKCMLSLRDKLNLEISLQSFRK